MKILCRLVILAAILCPFAFPGSARAGLFGSNTIDDVFTVKSIANGQAVTEGDPKTLKAGDKLYFARSPFQFTVVSVSGKTVTIALPGAQDLVVGNTLMRKANDQVKKGIDSENKLKAAAEE